MQRRNAGT